MRSPETRAAGARRAAALTAASILAVLGIAYYFTHEPAPAVDIRWREGVAPDRRAAIERQFRLLRPRNREGRTFTYDLVDTRSSNIRALLETPEVEDSGRFDLNTFTVRPDAPYGTEWMWAGTRLPLLRLPGVVPAIVVACSLVATYPFWQRVMPGRRRS